MLRISLTALGIYVSALAAFSQSANDSSAYSSRKLKVEEVNFISSYYAQDGNNSAVTGGIGTESLTDFASTIDVKLSRYDGHKRKHTLTGEIGIDLYTSASSDKIDPSTISSASAHDKRIYPSITYAITNEQKGTTISVGGSLSTEFDYFSKGISAGWSKLSKDRNREFSFKGQVFLDTWKVILPVELRSSTALNGNKPRDSYSASFTLSQVLNKRMQVLFLADFAMQTGQLATLYHRTYFEDGTHRVEKLPDKRVKIPVGVRLNYFAGDRVIVRTYYRYYTDDWGLTAHTAELEVPVKITPFFSVSPFYRYYTQQGVKYFAPYQQHQTGEEFYTSDYDLSTLSSNMGGLGVRYAPPGGVLNITTLNALELRYGHYKRSTGLSSDIITMLIKFK
ncbi:DUF3570 domain-containing protein [Chryseolinea lacunae]|uniref:DUF3570 domain-containing protein n=1 Tax=Chryseolinea lacunae TaxID=2801331 RepID=A0ABS1KN87_9BACT|nr:DUF3570 domain-containing protein [Chryseolinea lacunae]MBL0740809.1 DUF3570 domain-containing protein [Chryseolinea lacunae]